MVKKVLENKNHWKSYFDHEYIGGFSLLDMDAIVTITKYSEEVVKNEKKKTESLKFVLYIKDAKDEHKMIVNKTNAEALEYALGSPNPDDWVGRKIQLYTERVKAFGAEHDALRVRRTAPKEDVDVTEDFAKLNACTTLEQLQAVYQSLPNRADKRVVALKDELKAKYASK